MIEFRNVSKKYFLRKEPKDILKSINFTIEKDVKLGILGRNGAGKSTLIRLISGAELPSAGEIIRSMSVSWPLAFSGAFQGSLTGLDNLKFVCRIYGLDYKNKMDYVQEFAELGKYFYEPVKKYSSGMQSRLAFAISMAIDFDCFLIDEIVAVGDSRFHEKCRYELFDLRKDRAMVIVSHDIHYIKNHCNKAAVLNNGHLTTFENVDDAFDFYNKELII